MLDESVCAEGFGPGACAVLVTGSKPDAKLHEAVRDTLHRHGGRAGAQNSVAYLFHPVGVLRFATVGKLASRALEAGAEDVRALPGGETEVLTDPADLPRVGAALARKGHAASSQGLTWRAGEPVTLEAEQVARLQALMAELRALKGVVQVYTNAAVPEQLLAPV